MKCGKNYSISSFFVVIIAVINFNITPINCYERDNKDSNEFSLESSEQDYNNQHHQPITFYVGKKENFPWRQKSYNIIESEQQLPSSSSSSIVGLQQQSNQGYNSWAKQNHYKHDNENHKFIASKHTNYNEINKFANNDYGSSETDSHNIYGTDIDNIENDKRSSMPTKRNYQHRHQSLCETIEERIHLNTDSHEYRPDHYYERKCKYATVDFPHRIDKVCNTTNGFECVTKKGKIFLTRHLKGSANHCWETDIREISNGCECSWPIYPQGDITPHYQQI